MNRQASGIVSAGVRCLTAELSGKRSPFNSTQKYHNIVRSNDVLSLVSLRCGSNRLTIPNFGDRRSPLWTHQRS